MNPANPGFESQKLSLEIIREAKAAEIGIGESYNSRAISIASLSTIAVSLIFGFGVRGFITETTAAVTLVIAMVALVLALVAALATLWPRSGRDRDLLYEEIVDSVESFSAEGQLDIEHQIVKTKEITNRFRKTTEKKRFWIRGSYATLGIGVIFLAAGAVITAVEKI